MNIDILNKGINNLLYNCAKLTKNDSLLIISEDSKFGWYDQDASRAVYDYAKNKLGLKAKLLSVSEPKNNSINSIETIIDDYDCTIFFARIGDQDRFEHKSFNTKRVMSYVRNIESLTSSFASTNYVEMNEFKNVINELFCVSGWRARAVLTRRKRGAE